MDEKKQHKPEIYDSFTLEELEFSIFDSPARPKKKARPHYKDAYDSLARDISRIASRAADSRPDLAGLAAELDAALERAARRLQS